MKSQEKVKRQRRIKSIPVLMWGFRARGLMVHGMSDNNPSSKRQRRRVRVEKRSRIINRGR